MTSRIQWTGKNTRQVKAWLLERHAAATTVLDTKIAYFLPRRGGGMTEGMWKFVAEPEWGRDVTAAVYDYTVERYVPVKSGEWIVWGPEGQITARVGRKK